MSSERLVEDSAGPVATPPPNDRFIWDLAGVLVMLSVLALAAVGAATMNVMDRDGDGDGGLLASLSVRKFLSETPANTPFSPGELPDDIMNGMKVRVGDADVSAGGAFPAEDGSGPVLFGQDSEYAFTSLLFNLERAPGDYVVLLITGMDDDAEGRVPVRIALNDNVVYEGPSPFLDGRRTSTAWVVENPDWAVAGENQLTVENIAEGGATGAPWIRVFEATLYID